MDTTETEVTKPFQLKGGKKNRFKVILLQTEPLEVTTDTPHVRLQEKTMRIIIALTKQALNQNKFHPPSKQPMAAHLPPFLKHPSRAALWPRHSQQPHGNERPASLPQQKAPSTLREEEGPGAAGPQSLTTHICLMSLWADPILSSDSMLQPGLNSRLSGTGRCLRCGG